MSFQLLLAVAEKSKLLEGYRFPFLAGLAAALVSWFVTPYVRSFAIRKGAVDDPKRDSRRVHTEPIPRWGGIAIFSGIFAAIGIVLPIAYPHNPFPHYLIVMMVVALGIVVMGGLDDLYQYSAKIQALFLLSAGIVVQFFWDAVGRIQIQGVIPFWSDSHQWQSFGWAIVPLTALYIFVVTKTMDTIDGVDGLASGIAAISAATLTLIAVHSGQPRVALIAGAVAGSAIGFLRHNYNPAKIFLGTGGAQLLGFMLACLSIVGALKTAAAIALVIPILVFGVPILDAGFVVIRRVLSGQPITQADKRHLHHTLMGKGLSQRQTVWVLYLFAIVLCGTLIAVVKLRG